MESLRRLTSSIFDSESRLSLGRRNSPGNGILSPTSEAAAHAAQTFAPTNLDITFITNRLVVMGYPIQGPTDKKRNQNNIDDLAEYLEMHHSNQYLIFNLNSLEDDVSSLVQVQDLDSFISSDPSTATTAVVGERKQTSALAEKVRQQMVEFGWERDGMKAHTPPFDHIFRICYAIFAWLSLDAANIALINCQTGKTRSGIVVASYLVYARLADDPLEAFVEFYRKRWDMKSLTSEALRLKTPQSVQRFLACLHDLIENQRIPNPMPLTLKGIIIRNVPVEHPPCIQIWDDYRLLYCTSDGPQQLDQSQGQEGPVIDWDGDDGCLAILWENGVDLDGGFSIMCSFGDEYEVDETTVDASSRVLFRYADSTWFLAPGLVTLAKSKLDIMKQYEEAFNEEYFAMDLVFTESKKTKRKNVPIGFSGNAAVRQGVIEITKQHLVLPDPGMHSNFMKMGYSDAATTFALQRSQNAPNIALDILHSSVISTCFGQILKPSDRSGQVLQSKSSPSREIQLQRADKGNASPLLVRRQSTAEIAALQSQRSRYSPMATEVASICIACKDDDYMLRPQLVRCKGSCENSYHTTCVGLKRIPFGLTTLSDRTNHGVYMKKYFNAWECDTCAATRTTQGQDEDLDQPHSPRHPVSKQWMAQTKVHGHLVRSPAPVSDQSQLETPNSTPMDLSNVAGDGQMDKLKEFLAVSGVSIEDLLRAATTANMTISPSAGTVELPKTLEETPPSCAASLKSTMGKHFGSNPMDGHGNPQDSTPKRNFSSDRQSINPEQRATETRLLPGDAQQQVQQSEIPTTSGQTSILGAVKSRDSSQADGPAVQPSDKNHVLEEAKTTPPDPKAALLAQIASRSGNTATNSGLQVSQSAPPRSNSPEGEGMLKDTMTKYQLMLQRGVPFEAVQNCMKKDCVDPSRLVALPQVVRADEKPKEASSGTKLKDMKEFSSYFSMLRMGCPRPAVHQKIMMDGADPVVLDLGPDAIFDEVKDKIKINQSSDVSSLQDDIKSVRSYKKTSKPSEPERALPSPANDSNLAQTMVTLKDHEVYSKYFKMLKMGLPEDAVRHKIQRDGHDIRALELGGDAPYSKLTEKPAEVRLGDDPVYSKFFKMLKMGLPVDAVRHKMQMESADVRALDLGADAFVSQLIAAASTSKTQSPVAKPKVRRKKLHWQPIADDRLSGMNRQTIWEDKDDEGVDFDMDMDEIESLFFASNDSEVKKSASSQAKSMKRKQSVTLIDGKRAMNAAISLARVKLTYAEIGYAISVFDAKGLTVEQLRGIREFLPTQEEVSLVNNYRGDQTLLGEAEKFILEISKVKRYTRRTECLLFRMSFSPRYQELNVSLDNLIDACQQVKESRLLKILLSMVLKLGNTLNGSGDDNEIRGFTVDSLLRLGHTKAVNQKTTVLHYLIRLVKKNHPAVLDFLRELKSVPLAARESFEAVDEDFGSLQSGLTLLSEEFQELQKDEMDALTRETVTSLQGAVEDIGSQMELVDQRIKRARDEVQSVLEYFGEDPTKNLSSFFTTLTSFCTMFETARKEVDAADEAQQRAERLKMRRNASMRPNQAVSTSTRGLRVNRDRAMSDRGFLIERKSPPHTDNDVA